MCLTASFLATGGFKFELFQNACTSMLYKHAYLNILITVAAFSIYALRGEDAANFKREVGGCALNIHGNYIVDRGKSWEKHGFVFLNFCGNPVLTLNPTKYRLRSS